MERYLQAIALVLVTVLAALVVTRENRDWTVLLSMAACCAVWFTVVEFLSPVVQLLQEIRQVGRLDSTFLSILLKCAGIGILTELVSMICADAGFGSLGKILQTLSNGAILWLSIPMIRQLLTMLQEVLGGL